MRGVIVFAAFAIAIGAACDTSDVLEAYAEARANNDDCDYLVNSMSSYFFSEGSPSAAMLADACNDDCTLTFMWNLYTSGCAPHSDVREAFSGIMSTCECDLDAFFVAAGGNCITSCSSDVCIGHERGSHFDDPYIATTDGNGLVMHVAGATLTFASDSVDTGAGDGVGPGGAVGMCQGAHVTWDHNRGVCVPNAQYLAAGSRLLPFHDLASQDELENMETLLNAELDNMLTFVTGSADSIAAEAAGVVASTQESLADLRDSVTNIQSLVASQLQVAESIINERMEDLSSNLNADFEELTQDIEENVIERVNSMTDMGDSVGQLMAAFENTAFLDHSKPVYRWGVWSSYNQWQGWYGHGHHGDENMFGGVDPQRWGDSNALVWDMRGNKDVLRGLFNKRGYMGWQGTMWNHEWFSHSSTNSQHAGALFRIRNTNGGATNWRVNFYYTCYSGWSERASATLNGQSNWQSGGSNCGGHCDTNVNFNIPGGRISTVIIIVASSPRSSGCCDFGPRGNWLAFRDNTLRLPNGLEYVDDMDYAQGGWDR